MLPGLHRRISFSTNLKFDRYRPSTETEYATNILFWFVKMWKGKIVKEQLVEQPAITWSHHFFPFPWIYFSTHCHILQPRCPKAEGRVKSKATSSRHKSIEVPRRPTLAQAMTVKNGGWWEFDLGHIHIYIYT